MKTAEIVKQHDLKIRCREDQGDMLGHLLGLLRRHVDVPSGETTAELEQAVVAAVTKLDYLTAHNRLLGHTADFDNIRSFVDAAELSRERNRETYIISCDGGKGTHGGLEQSVVCGDETEEEMQYAN